MASGSMDGARFSIWETGCWSELRGSGNRNCEGVRLEGNLEACEVAEPARRSGNRASEACTRQTHDPGNRKMGA